MNVLTFDLIKAEKVSVDLALIARSYAGKQFIKINLNHKFNLRSYI